MNILETYIHSVVFFILLSLNLKKRYFMNRIESFIVRAMLMAMCFYETGR